MAMGAKEVEFFCKKNIVKTDITHNKSNQSCSVTKSLVIPHLQTWS